MEYFMIKTFNKFRINFTTAFLLMMSSFFYLVSCNDTVDDLWDDSNPRDDYSPVIGDWYADSIKAYYSCVKTADSTSDVMSDSYIDNYNLWLLSDGSLQLFLNVYKAIAGNYCESVIPDPIPNSEVKPFSADGTLS